MTISLRLSEDDSALFRRYAEINGLTLSELVRQSVMERIEDEYDLKLYDMAMEEYKLQPKSFSLDAAEKELGLR